jgi:hypothetical protein
MKKTMLVLALAGLSAMPAAARLWKPTPQQAAIDYTVISHNKGADGRVIVQWVASTAMTGPTMQQLMDKYVVISVAHSRQGASGVTTYDDIEGVQVTDGQGNALKQVPDDQIPPSLVGMFATSDAIMRRNTQGTGKQRWSVYESGSVHPCGPGKLQVTYDGETYTWDTPLPGCPKS